MQKKREHGMTFTVLLLTLSMVLCSCTGQSAVKTAVSSTETPGMAEQIKLTTSKQEQAPTAFVKTGWIAEQILASADGEIHYSYYLPKGYNTDKAYPMVVVMPGYDMMWFGEKSAGKNLDWDGVQVWTKQKEDIIVVSAQLTDWGKKSAKQSIELTEYMLQSFSVDKNRVYAVGYSAGGETMSQAVAMRPDLYAAYFHGASQWDGSYASVADQGVAVYIFMAESDEYYGSGKAHDAYNGLQEASKILAVCLNVCPFSYTAL